MTGNDIKTALMAKLGEENSAVASGYYIDSRDFLPSINTAIDMITEFIARKQGSTKFTEEGLSFLRKVWIFQTNSFSRIYIDGSKVWAITVVHPKPVVFPSTSVINVVSNVVSQYRTDVSFVSSDYSCDRATDEEYSIAQNNPFAAGFNKEPNRKIVQYTANWPSDYTSTNYNPLGGGPPPPAAPEIEISPYIPKEFVGIRLIKVPKHITAMADTLDFPDSIKQFLVDCALYSISPKQGDGTTAHSISLEGIIQSIQTYS